LYLSAIDFLKTTTLSAMQLATLRAAYQEILSALENPAKRGIPAELSETIARKILAVANSADYDRATIVQMVFDEIGVVRPEKLKH
jgi:hypothetical protein